HIHMSFCSPSPSFFALVRKRTGVRRSFAIDARLAATFFALDPRHSHGEHGSFAGTLARGADVAVLRFDQRLREREPQSEAATRAIKRLMTLHEHVEDM